jgi:hypothetical protein
MLAFYLNVTDSSAFQFAVVLQVPTQDGEGDPRWGADPGVLSFRNGPAVIAASGSRGTVVCFGIDADGNRWAAIEFDQLIPQFSRNGNGSYGALQLNNAGTGSTFPDTVVSAQPGAIRWSIVVPTSGS